MIYMTVLGDLTLVRKMHRDAATIDKKMEGVTQYWGNILNSRIKAKASGRPGPNAPTGDYRRSWVHTVQSKGGTTTSTNGTNKPQARRLEFGFSGSDALGRVYAQPPYPHVGPAKDEIEPGFVKSAGQLARSIL